MPGTPRYSKVYHSVAIVYAPKHLGITVDFPKWNIYRELKACMETKREARKKK